MNNPDPIAQLFGFDPPQVEPLPDEIVVPFTDAVKGRRFLGTQAVFVSRYGNAIYEDHPLQWLEFTADGERLRSHCPGPDGSDASVAGPWRLQRIDGNGDYVVELVYGCRTTFVVKQYAVEACKAPLPDLITCQRRGCPQRHRSRVVEGFHDVDELSGMRKLGDPGVVELKGCTGCRQVHYCSKACQKADWRDIHRVECKRFRTVAPPDIDIASANAADMKSLLMYVCQSCITTGEERAWNPFDVERAKQVGRRLFEIGGMDLCVTVCDELRLDLANDRKRAGDARMLEYVWCDPVVPGWWP